MAVFSFWIYLKSRPLFWAVTAVAGAVFILSVGLSPAQGQTRWALDRPIPNYDNLRPPLMVADNNRTVHAVYTVISDTEGEVVIYYRRWSVEQGWSAPIDILVRERIGQVAVQGFLLDEQGILHLLFFDGGPDSGAVYYMRAPAVWAESAQSWSPPREVGLRAEPLPFAALVGDGRDDLVVLYGGRERGIGLYAVHSHDSGQSWSTATLVAPVYEPQRWPGPIRADMDEAGRVHAVWSIVSDEGLGEEVYYARLDSERTAWTPPTLLTQRQETDYSANWPSIIIYEDELFVIYQNSFPATRWLRRSTDGGDSWSDPIRPFPHIGEYEHAVMLVDGDNRLHMVLGNRIGNPGIHGMWHSVWLGDRWRGLEPIVSGPASSQFDPSAPRAVIAQGNILLAAWWHNTPDVDVPWYSYTILDAEARPLQPLPAPTTTPTPTPTPTRAAEAPEPTRTLPQLEEEQTGWASNPAIPLAAGALPVLALIGLIIFITRQRNS